jgi:hypothetical protein
MITIATSQYRNVPRPCRSATGHGVICPDHRFGAPRKGLLPTSASPFGRNDLLNHGIVADQCARSTCRNSHTAPAAPKSP